MSSETGVDQRKTAGCDGVGVAEERHVLAAPAEAGGADFGGGAFVGAQGGEPGAHAGLGDGLAVVVEERDEGGDEGEDGGAAMVSWKSQVRVGGCGKGLE